MRPAFSVVFLTTLIGAGQGLFLALYMAEGGAALGWIEEVPASRFFVTGAIVSLTLAALGLVASFFHLGRPERAWRSAAMWRTSWLSREVIALPLFMARWRPTAPDTTSAGTPPFSSVSSRWRRASRFSFAPP